MVAHSHFERNHGHVYYMVNDVERSINRRGTFIRHNRITTPKWSKIPCSAELNEGTDTRAIFGNKLPHHQVKNKAAGLFN